jgi:hypothetical protein
MTVYCGKQLGSSVKTSAGVIAGAVQGAVANIDVLMSERHIGASHCAIAFSEKNKNASKHIVGEDAKIVGEDANNGRRDAKNGQILKEKRPKKGICDRKLGQAR